MKVSVEARARLDEAAELLALPLAKLEDARARLPARASAVDAALGGQITAAVRSGDFRGEAGQQLLLYRTGKRGPRRVLLLGIGDAKAVTAETLRQLGGRAVAAARKVKAVALPAPTSRQLRVAEAARALAEGAVLGSFRSDGWKTQRNDDGAGPGRLQILVPDAAAARAARPTAARGVALAESQNLARRLSNEPPNELSPAALAREARRMARQEGLTCRVLGVPEMRELGMGALLAVGQGSANTPRLVVMEHRPKRGTRKRPTVCVVGKGITFDSGGVSIKPSAGMQDMKHDMSGAAAVTGLMQAVARLDVPLHVVGLLAAAENMPGGSAYRPGDILTSLSGRTIEIQNTDAEGRLVLADALSYACDRYAPDAIIDLATLTGACVVALGPWATGVFGNHDGLVEAIRRAGEASGERAWPMPVWDAHRDHMRSSYADLKNVGGRDAGASTAAAFLSSFVGSTPWVHLDIAGTGWTAKPGPCQPYGATGVGVRLLADLLLDWPHAGLV